MKISKTIAWLAAASIAAGVTTAAPANAACYWGSDGVLVVDETGQCTITTGPPFLDPNAGSNPAPSAPSAGAPTTPVVEITPTPTPTPTPTSTSTAKPKLVTHRVGDFPDSINTYPIRRIQITDMDDPGYATTCYQSFSCELALPEGHKWGYSILSDYEFYVFMEGVSDSYHARVESQLLLGNHVASRVVPPEYPTNVKFQNRVVPLVLTALSDIVQVQGFDKYGIMTGVPMEFNQWQPLSITQNIKTSKKINWSNLPPGLVEGADGTISGSPSTSGTFKVEANFGSKNNSGKYMFFMYVHPGLSAPRELKSARTDLTSADFTFNLDVTNNTKTVPEFFEIELKNVRTSNVVKKYFDGSSRAGMFRDLLPGDTYKIRMRSGKSNPLKYSPFSEEIELKPQAPTQYFTAVRGALKVTQTWLEGSSTSVVVSIPSTKGGQVQARIAKSAKLTVTKAQAKAFSNYYDGLYMSNAGEITGTVTKSDVALKPLTLQIGTVVFVFRFSK